MVEKQASRGIPREELRDGLRLQEIDALLRAHGASIRSVDNHHWQISRGERSGLWLLGDGAARSGGGLDPDAIERLQRVLHSTGLLCERDLPPPPTAAMAAAILWLGKEATRIYWINEQGLGGEGAQSIGHWLHGEITLHRDQRTASYLQRILAMLERIERALLIGCRARREEGRSGSAAAASNGATGSADEAAARRPPLPPSASGDLRRLTRLLESERPDLRERVVGILTVESEQLDDALLFSMAQRYLHPQGHPLGLPGRDGMGG